MKKRQPAEKFGKFLSQLAEKSEYVYWLSSPDFKTIQYVSPAYEKIWGRKLQELYDDPKKWITFLHPEDAADHHPIHVMKERIEKLGSEARYQEDYRIIRPNGEIRWIMDRGFPIYDAQGRCLGVTGVALDVTKEKQAELDLIKSKEIAELANKAKEDFLYNMRHDIRTPFAGISGLSEVLCQQEQDPIKQKYLQAIHASSEQLLNYLNEILEFTQIEGGEVPIVSHEISLKDIAQNCADMYLPAMEENRLHFTFDYDEKLPDFLYSDEFRLKRIIINLIGNAVKFTSQGSIHLKISVADKKSTKEKIYVAITVEDTGVGIPKDQQQAIFEKFKRLTPSYQGKYKGSGLGLFAVKTLMNELQGEISVISDLDKGSVFTCVIPMIKAKSSAKKKVLKIEKPSSVVYSTLKKQARILLVEDMPIIQMATVSMLEEFNCAVEVADTGRKAIKMFGDNDYDLVLMDIGLPDIDGYEVAKKMRATPKGNKATIIALTAHAADDVNELCSSVAMNAVLQKPLKRNMAQELLNTYVYKNICSQETKNMLSTEEFSNIKIIDMADSISKQGNKENTIKYLRLLSGFFPSCLNDLKSMMEKENMDALKKEVHKLKGAISLVTLPGLQKAVDEFNDRVKGKNDRPILPLYMTIEEQIRIFEKNI